jgi:hypothetical protein
MKVSILSESEVDEAGIRILAEAVLGVALTVIDPVRVRARGFPAAMKRIPSTYKSLHWNSDADGLIIVVDSDESPIHEPSHESSGFNDPDCRWCQIGRTISEIQSQISQRPNGPLRVAIGLAVPAIEAWYLCGRDIHCTEGHFSREPSNALYEIRRDLKRKAYGAHPAPHELMKQKAMEECNRVAKILPLWSRTFPGVSAFSPRRFASGNRDPVMDVGRGTDGHSTPSF